nr:YfhO family protein [Nakamurella aerolata]
MANRLLDRLGARWVIAQPGAALPGRALSLQGQPLAGDPPPGPSTALADGATVAIPATGTTVRGVQLRLTAPVERGTKVAVRIRVLGADGTELATGGLTSNGAAPGWLTVPVAGAAIPAQAPVRIEVRNEGAPLTLLRGQGQQPYARWVVPDPAKPDNLVLVFSDTHGTLWERTSALPRIRWAGSAEVLPDEKTRLERLQSPELPAGTAVFNAPPPGASSGATAQLDVVEDSGDRIAVRVNARGAGHLVVADSMPSGWTATVDGTEVPIALVDQAFAAVPVPAGEHLVEFDYTGSHRTLGIAVSAGAVLLLLAAGALVWWRRRRTG